MQRQFTIEARCDFADKDKFNAVQEYGRELAVRWNAFIKLLCESDRLEQKPQVAYFSDDFFVGHDEIDVMPDTLLDAEEKHANICETATVSEDMMEAMHELQQKGT